MREQNSSAQIVLVESSFDGVDGVRDIQKEMAESLGVLFAATRNLANSKWSDYTVEINDKPYPNNTGHEAIAQSILDILNGKETVIDENEYISGDCSVWVSGDTVYFDWTDGISLEYITAESDGSYVWGGSNTVSVFYKYDREFTVGKYESVGWTGNQAKVRDKIKGTIKSLHEYGYIMYDVDSDGKDDYVILNACPQFFIEDGNSQVGEFYEYTLGKEDGEGAVSFYVLNIDAKAVEDVFNGSSASARCAGCKLPIGHYKWNDANDDWSLDCIEVIGSADISRSNFDKFLKETQGLSDDFSTMGYVILKVVDMKRNILS